MANISSSKNVVAIVKVMVVVVRVSKINTGITSCI